MRISKTIYNKDVGAMTRRLAQLAEEARPLKDDPVAGKSALLTDGSANASKDKETTGNQFEALYSALKSEESRFNYEHQRELSYTKIPGYAPIQSQQIALNRPWTGQELPEDITRRLISDKAQFKDVTQSLNPLKPLKAKKKVAVSERLLKAREGTLDYKLNKEVSNKPKDDPMFSQLYKDRFLMGSGNSVISAMQSLASQRIEDAIARNEFKDLPRGQAQKKDYYASSPFIETTEYFLNKMIQRQGAAPPWVEKQVRVNKMIARNRETILQSWVSYAVGQLLEMHKDISDAEEKVRISATTIERVKRGHAKQWEQQNSAYHEELIRDTNSTIRGYNLQAPASARKTYLNLQKELELCYEGAVERIVPALKKHLLVEDVPEAIDRKKLYQAEDLRLEDPSKHYGIGDLLKDLFRRTRKPI